MSERSHNTPHSLAGVELRASESMGLLDYGVVPGVCCTPLIPRQFRPLALGHNHVGKWQSALLVGGCHFLLSDWLLHPSGLATVHPSARVIENRTTLGKPRCTAAGATDSASLVIDRGGCARAPQCRSPPSPGRFLCDAGAVCSAVIALRVQCAQR